MRPRSVVGRLPDAIVRLLLSFRFRYDVFISYKRGEAAADVAKLNEQLIGLNFTCFLDREECPPGRPLTPSLRQALGKSATLVLVGTEEALASPYVRLDVEEFGKTHRTLVPIDVDGAIRRSAWSRLRETELVWLDESPAALPARGAVRAHQRGDRRLLPVRATQHAPAHGMDRRRIRVRHSLAGVRVHH